MNMNHFSAKVFLVVFVLLSMSLVSAQNYSVWLHTIDITVDSSGQANISEKFHLFFPTETDKVQFRDTSTNLGSDIDKWKLFNTLFQPNIGTDNQINGKISYSEGIENYLEISYGLVDTLMARGKETAMIEEFTIKASYFNNFYQSGIWVIPDNTQINIELPPGAEVNETIEPLADIINSGPKKIFSWKGYKSANQLVFNYRLWKKITPIVDLNALITFLFRTNEGWIILGGILLVIAGIVWQRKKIATKIEEFVENNTVIEEE